MLEEQVIIQLKNILKEIKNDVYILFFSQEIESEVCKETDDFLKEIAVLNPKMHLEKFDFLKNKIVADKYNVDKIPAIVILNADKKDSGVKFYGLPGGYEINSFVQSIIEISGNKIELPQDVIKRIALINNPVTINIIVSLNCPHCSDAVHVANRLAIENENIQSCMIDAVVFPHLAVKYNVSSVPKIIINEKYEFVGAQSIEKLIDVIGSK